MIDEKIDIAIICATTLEFKELGRALTDSIESMRRERVGNRIYEIQKIAGLTSDAGLTLALVSPNEIGRVAAALAARDLLYHFSQRPDCVILCGIAAADPESGYQLGDVVLPQVIVDYAEQKRSLGKVRLRARQFALHGWLHEAAVEFSATNWFDAVPKETVRISKELNKQMRTPSLCHHDLGMACGDYVLDDKELVRDILSRLSTDQKFSVTTVEMESTAVARGIEMQDGDTPEYLVVKAISDFAYGKNDSAQPYARATAAYFLKGFLMELARSHRFGARRAARVNADVAKTVLGPSTNVVAMLREFPPEYADQWRHRAIDGAIEILRCAKPGNAYGGFTNDQIICDINDNIQEWPDQFGGITQNQTEALVQGLLGARDIGISGWLKEKRATPGRIRVLTGPPTPTVLDRPSLFLSFANSDYFTVRSITELSRSEQPTSHGLLKQAFPERWAPPQSRFSNKCIPYHVSAQGILICRTPDHSSYLLLASVSADNPTIAEGWGATMSEQMWAPNRSSSGESWWKEPARSFFGTERAAETRVGDSHIGETLARGLSEEFRINVERELDHPPLLLLAAIEEDMYFVTFIYLVTVNLPLSVIYDKWDTAPDRYEMGLLAAYQLTGQTASGEELSGPHRLAELIAGDTFDAGPYLLPEPRRSGEASGSWHVSSRLRMYALGMHMWPNEFSRLVTRR